MSNSLCEKRSKVMKMNKDSDDDDDQAVKPKLLLADKVRSDSSRQFRRRAEKVWAVSTCKEKEEDESPPQEPEPDDSEEKVGDIVRFGRSSYFIVDIFEKEIMELGDKVDLNFKRFEKFKAVYGDAPRDHYFYKDRCCYSSCCCACGSGNIEKDWEILKTQLALREEKGVTFFVRTYEERRELMRVAVTLTHGDPSYTLFFFDIKFPSKYPNEAPSFFYHPYGLPLSKPRPYLGFKLRYNLLDVFLHIEEIVLMNNNKSCLQMLDILKRPLTGFEDFVKGHFRARGAFILRNMMEELDMEKERDKNMFWKMYIAFEDNKAYCEHILNKDLKEELKRIKEKEYSLSDYFYSSSSNYFPTIDDIQKTSKYQNFWNKFSSFYSL